MGRLMQRVNAGPGLEPTAARCAGAALCLLGLVVLCRPIASAAQPDLGNSALYGLVLLTAVLLWLAANLLRGRLLVALGWPEALFGAFLAWCLVVSLVSADRFTGVRRTYELASYGLTALVAIHLGRTARARRFLLSCLLATCVALAFFALWDYFLYWPALRAWMDESPDVFQAVVGGLEDSIPQLADRRAYGNFMTPNQLADFLLIGLFPLAGLLVGRWRRRRSEGGGSPVPLVGAALCLLTVAAAVVLSRSRGGWVATVFGGAVFVVIGWGGILRRHPWKLIGGIVLVGVVLQGLVILGRLPGQQLLGASFAGRAQHWRTTLRTVREHPVRGVGPGAWEDWYLQFKEPEYGETQFAHSTYLHAWAETGSVGLLLFIAFWVALLHRMLRGGPPAPDRDEEGAEAGQRALLIAGLSMAALVFAADYLLSRRFCPSPFYAPAWLAAVRPLPYVAVYAVWCVSFVLLFGAPGGAERRMALAGLGAALGAFLLHSSAEITLWIPAIGGSVGVLVALLALETGGVRFRRVAVSPVKGLVLAAVGCGVLLFWSLLPTARALTYGTAMRRAGALQIDSLLGGASGAQDSGTGLRGPLAILMQFRVACRAVPWEDEAWRERGAFLLDIASPPSEQAWMEAAGSAARAIQLNGLDSANQALMGRVWMVAGQRGRAADAYRTAAELCPSYPGHWYRLALAAEGVEGRSAEAEAAYERAFSLIQRQWARNRVLGAPLDLVQVWADLTGAGLQPALLGMFRARWREADTGRPWSDLEERERLEFAVEAAGLDLEGVTLPDSPPPGFLWEIAGPEARCALLLDVATGLSALAGGPEVPESLDDQERVRRVTDGLKGAEALAERWRELAPDAREDTFWRVAAGRLWTWALKAKTARFEQPAPGPS